MKRLIISILIAAVILSGCSAATNNTANADPFGHISLYAKGKTNSI